MKNLFNRTLSVLCAVMLLISAVSAWAAAEEEYATPTDLIPAEEEIIPEEPGKDTKGETETGSGQGTEVKPEGESESDGIDSVEVIITKTLTVGQSWEGKMKKTKPAVLKLDITRPGLVYMLVEGKDVWATVEKSDRLTENPARTQTDPETDRLLLSWEAEEGSYLITLGPVEPNLLAKATVSFMNQAAYDAWEAEQAKEEPELEEEPEAEPEEGPEEEPVGQSEDESEVPEEINEEENEPAEEEIKPEEPDEELVPEAEQPENVEPEENKPESEIAPQRDIIIDIIHDSPHPVIGDTAHFRTTLYGYENLHYSIQWQYSTDNETWTDIPGANDLDMDVVVTPENNLYYWRIMIYVEEDQET